MEKDRLFLLKISEYYILSKIPSLAETVIAFDGPNRRLIRRDRRLETIRSVLDIHGMLWAHTTYGQLYHRIHIHLARVCFWEGSLTDIPNRKDPNRNGFEHNFRESEQVSDPHDPWCVSIYSRSDKRRSLLTMHLYRIRCYGTEVRRKSKTYIRSHKWTARSRNPRWVPRGHRVPISRCAYCSRMPNRARRDTRRGFRREGEA